MRFWSFERLDNNDRSLGTLDGVTGGSAEIVTQARLGGSGTLVMDERGQGVNWMRDRIRAIFHDGEHSWPFGTYMLSSPIERHSEFGVTYEIGLSTKMLIPDEETLDARFSLEAGAPVIPAVVDLLRSTGETRIAVTPSEMVRATAGTWEAGTPKLTVINELLGSVGYSSLWCDGSGQYRIEKYVSPAQRPVAHRFIHGPTSIHMPDWSRIQNLADVPNRVVLRTEGQDGPGLVGIAVNEDASSPFSRQARRRWISPEVEVVEAESQLVIDQLAERRLRDRMSPVSRITAVHDMRELQPAALIGFTPEDAVDRLATVQRMAVNFTFDTDVQAEWREVA